MPQIEMIIVCGHRGGSSASAFVASLPIVCIIFNDDEDDDVNDDLAARYSAIYRWLHL